MVDTIQTLSTLQTNLANNTNKEITAQRLRDLAVTAVGARYLSDVNADTALTDDHNVVTVDASGGNKTITLPTAIGRTHRMFTVKKRDSANTWVAIVGTSSQTIDGHIKEYLTFPGASITVISDGANWQVLDPARNILKLLYIGTANATFNTSASETDVTPTGLGIALIPPDFYRVGRGVRARIRGFLNVTGTPTLTVRQKLNAVTVATTGAIAMAAATNSMFELEIMMRARAIGAGGNLDIQGVFRWGGTGTPYPIVNTAVVSLDTTANQPITLTAQFSVSNALNAFTVTEYEQSYAA